MLVFCPGMCRVRETGPSEPWLLMHPCPPPRHAFLMELGLRRHFPIGRGPSLCFIREKFRSHH